MLDDVPDDEALDRARRELYRLPPEQFPDARAAATDRHPGVAKLRKPTVAAWIVNAHADPDVVAALTGLGARLAKAQADLETGAMRELTLERRRLVAETTRAALDAAGRSDAGATLREEVAATFDAAIADPDVAERLGALQRPERWSGFGAVAPGAALALVPERKRSKPAPPEPEPPEAEPEDDHLTEAREALAQAETALADATSAQDDLHTRLRRLSTRLSTLQHEIAQVREDLDDARTATAQAKRTRRGARSALDRLERRR